MDIHIYSLGTNIFGAPHPDKADYGCSQQLNAHLMAELAEFSPLIAPIRLDVR